MRKPRFLPALPGLPGPSLAVIVLSFPTAWQSPAAGTAESGLLHPHHPPGVSGEAEAQECPVCAHVARQEQCHDMGAGHHEAGESCPGLQLQQPSRWEAQLKVSRQNLHSGGREAEPLLCPQLLPYPCPVAGVASALPGGSCPPRWPRSPRAGSAQLTQRWLQPRCHSTAASRLRRLGAVSPVP